MVRMDRTRLTKVKKVKKTREKKMVEKSWDIAQ
jgi:hypothetical protein